MRYSMLSNQISIRVLRFELFRLYCVLLLGTTIVITVYYLTYYLLPFYLSCELCAYPKTNQKTSPARTLEKVRTKVRKQLES